MTTRSSNELTLSDLRPTQMTVGLREVLRKRHEWRAAKPKARQKLLRDHVLPVIIGPKGHLYLLDHHHFARALAEEKVRTAPVYIEADLQHLPKEEFWTFMDNNCWCHAYDSDGRRRKLGAIPKSLSDLSDDPFRSLVADVQRAGGCAKSDKPFWEFVWADFLRQRLSRHKLRSDYDSELDHAVRIARSTDAKHLPGWSGPDK